MSQSTDFALTTLLDLDGHQFTIENGEYTIKFVANLVEPTENTPHGVRYSLTLHDKTGVRVLGYDNSNHDYRPLSKRQHVARKIEWDHRHHKDTVTQYNFSTAANLLEDFWEDVRRVVGRWR
mgnify:CR=1 FL=1